MRSVSRSAEQKAERIARLPKWAQQEIYRLERDVAHYVAMLSQGPDDSNTFADPFSDARRPLGVGTMVEFHQTDGQKIRVSLERNRLTGAFDRLYVNGSDALQVQPMASNSLEIRVRRFS